MKNFLKYLLLVLVLIICIAIYKHAKTEGKLLGNKLKVEGQTL